MKIEDLTRAEIIAWLKQQPQETVLGTREGYHYNCPVALYLRGNGCPDALVMGKYRALIEGAPVNLPKEVGMLVEAFDRMTGYGHTIGEFLAYTGEGE